MTKQTEAMRLALAWIKGNSEHDQLCDVLDLDDEGKHKPCSCGLENAITALREALDHYEERLEMVEPVQERRVQQQFMDEEVLYLYTPRREALDEPVQPTETQLAYRRGYEQGKFDAAMEVAVQEPVRHKDWCASITQLLLSNPPQPAPCNCQPRRNNERSEEWVGLTFGEQTEIIERYYDDEIDFHDFARAIEAKLKELNSP